MANVPNTSTFKLSDVVTSINIAGVDSLLDCFTTATTSFFDATYVGSKDRLTNFRNYGVHMSASPESLQFDAEGMPYTTSTITITSNVTWTYSNGGNTWISCTPTTHAAGTTNVAIGVPLYAGIRNGTINWYNGAYNTTATISQSS